MPRLLDAGQAGAPLLVHAVMVERQQEIYVNPEIRRVSDVGLVRSLRAGYAKPVAHRHNNLDARQGVAPLIYAGWGVQQVVAAKQQPPPYNRL
jgi:hypothetical protein